VLIPSPYSVHASIPSQCVTVSHPTALSHLVIREAIEDAGFNIADITGAGHVQLSDNLDPPSHPRSRKAQNHLEYCQDCQYELKSGVPIETIQMENPSTPPPREPPFQDRLSQEAAIHRTGHSDGGPYRLTLSVGGMTCASCISAITQVLSRLPGVRDVSVSLLGSSATAILDNKVIVGDVVEAIRDAGYEADVASIQPLNSGTATFEMDGPLHVTLSVGGMTSAACSSTITQVLSEQEGVIDVSVTLIGSSASLVVKSKELIMGVKEVIESAGYEAAISSVEPLQVTSNAMKFVQRRRTVALRIEGMFCE
jgi:P-type Cu+ transporter